MSRRIIDDYHLRIRSHLQVVLQVQLGVGEHRHVMVGPLLVHQAVSCASAGSLHKPTIQSALTARRTGGEEKKAQKYYISPNGDGRTVISYPWYGVLKSANRTYQWRQNIPVGSKESVIADLVSTP
jgi:hypothetical protein